MFLVKLFQMKVIQNYLASVLTLEWPDKNTDERDGETCQNRVEIIFKMKLAVVELHWIIYAGLY